MYFDSDMSKLMQRYVGRQVTVQTHGYSRIIGYLASVHESCIRLRNVVRLHELEDSRWYGEIERQQQEEMEAGDAETLIATHAITCVSVSEYPGEPEDDSESAESGTQENAVRARVDDTFTEESVAIANLSVGAGLTAMLARDRSDLERVKRLRRDIRSQLGFTIPKVRVRDDFSLDSCGYRFDIGGVECATGEVRAGKLLAIKTDDATLPNDAETVLDPVFGLPACWIDTRSRDEAERGGCTVVDSWSVIITHMGEAIRRNASALLSYEETTRLVQSLRESFPSLVNDHFTDPESVLRLHRIFCELLDDGIPLNNPERIATAAAQVKRMKEEQSLLHVRRALTQQLHASAADREGRVQGACVSSDSQRRLAADDLSVSQNEARLLLADIGRLSGVVFDRGGRLVVAVDPSVFHAARRALAEQARSCLVVTSAEARSFRNIEFIASLGREKQESGEEFKSAGAAVAKPR